MRTLSQTVIGFYLALLLLWAFLFQGHIPFYIDTRLYIFPDRWAALDQYHRGFIPLWNAFVGCGTPQAASWVSGCFYPPFWILQWTGLNEGIMGLTLFHAALALGGFYLWLRSYQASPSASALGAFSFAGSAHLVECWNNLPFLVTAAWIPWIFWAAHRALQKPSLGRWTLLGLFLSLQIFAGYPFFVFYTLLFLVLWIGFQKPSRITLVFFSLTLLGAAGFTCLQWLPFLDFLQFSFHDRWTDYPYFTQPVEYLTLFQPDILGLPGAENYRGNFANANFNLYIGVFPLALLAGSGFRFFKNQNRFWTFAALGGLLWLAGRHFLLWRLFPAAWLEFVEPSKAAGLFVFSAVTAASLFLNRTFPEKTKTLPAWAWVLTALWLLDLGSLPFRLIHPVPNLYQDSQLQEEAQKLRNLAANRRILSVHAPTPNSAAGIDAFEDSSANPWRTFRPNSNVVWGLRSVEKYLFLQVDGSENITRYVHQFYPYNGDLLDVAGARLLLVSQKPASPKYKTVGSSRGGFWVLNSKASPDLRWVGEKMDFPNRPSILNTLALSGSGWEKKVYLEKKSDGTQTGLAPAARILNADPLEKGRTNDSRVSIELSFQKPGYLVFNETFCPGWKVWVDGKSQPLLRAYALFMAVALPEKGFHRVDFRYEPASFRLGLFLSLAALGLAFGILGRVWFRRA